MNEQQTLPSIDADAAFADTSSFLLDVREPIEWQAGHVDRAVHIPMQELVERIDELPKDRRIVCMCRSGNRSGRVVAYLRQHGYDAVNLSGGAQQWAGFGHPLVNHAGNPGVVA